ncbi:MAG: hypothetical protein HYU84_01550 [Chloroflexi bacterium]|nr:hypothetical protein [Chloroflexota bacterium]
MFFSHSPLSPVFYLDPGSGSILFQMIIAAILGAGILIRSQWSRIKRWFGAKAETTDETEENEENGGS